MASQLLLMRHASVGPEHAGRYLGRSDVPIARSQAAPVRSAADWLASKRVGRCVCSPMLRARQTAELVARTIEIDPDLREVDFGRWEGKNFDEIAKTDAEHVQKWAEMREDFAFPEGESMADFLARIKRAADRLASDPAKVVLAITHGGVIRSMICHYLGLGSKHYILFNVRYASCCVIDLFDGKGILSGLNQPEVA